MIFPLPLRRQFVQGAQQVKYVGAIMRSYRAYVLMSISCVLFLISISIMAADYDPAITLIESKYKIKDMTVHDNTRARDIQIRVYLPIVAEKIPVIINSHGLGGSRKGSSYLGKHWAARGYIVVYLQH